MAKQKGIIKLKGTIGDITFYKTEDGYMAREKGGIDANRIKNDPAFQRTRENGAEFGRAGKAAKVLRTAMREILQNCKDRRLSSRLTRDMVKVIQADTVSVRGERNVIDGEAELLLGFEFNIRSKLSTTLFAPFTTEINRVSGAMTVAFDSFTPVNMVVAPSGTTHFKIMSAGAEVNFEEESSVIQTSQTAMLPWNAAATLAITHTNTVTAASTKPLFLAVGIEFYQEVNGTMYSLKNGSYNSLALVKVSGM
ncbi:MAG: hypothetical protein PSV16_12770 [Flavobacterium sp.]|nr:hypothetical protein [Flavobacterium sp.]